MSHIIKIYALLVGSALLMFGGGLQGLLLAVRGAEEDFSLLALGLIGTGWSVGFVAGSISVPFMVKRVGHIRAYAAMAAIGGITILLNLLWINDVGWILLRVFSGFCFAGAAMIVESWLNEVSDNKSRGTIFSTYVMVNLAASTAGQLFMSVTGTGGYLAFVIGALAFMAATLPPVLTSSPQPRPLTSGHIDLGLLYRTSPVAVIASFAVGMANGTFGTLAPVFAYEKGLPADQIAYLMSAPVILGAAAQIPFGKASDMVDRRLVIIIASLIAALAGALMVILNPGNGMLLYALFGLYGFAAYSIYSIAVAHANDFAKDGGFAAIASGMLLVFGIGLALGPIIASLVMGIWNPVAMFVVTATFHTALALVALVRMRVRASIDPDDREPFRAMPVGKNMSTPTLELDPRIDEDQSEQTKEA